jgi:hypothetical protein
LNEFPPPRAERDRDAVARRTARFKRFAKSRRNFDEKPAAFVFERLRASTTR